LKKNYEIKCKADNLSALRRLLRKNGTYSFSIEKQKDTYYKVKRGRLKLRIINNETGNLIYYARDEKSGKRISGYFISATKNFHDLNEILKTQFEVLITVEKKREIYIKGNCRIHLDTVKNLGQFLEIEIIYKDFSKAEIQMEEIIKFLNLNENKFIKNSYSDLLIK